MHRPQRNPNTELNCNQGGGDNTDPHCDDFSMSGDIFEDFQERQREPEQEKDFTDQELRSGNINYLSDNQFSVDEEFSPFSSTKDPSQNEGETLEDFSIVVDETSQVANRLFEETVDTFETELESQNLNGTSSEMTYDLGAELQTENIKLETYGNNPDLKQNQFVEELYSQINETEDRDFLFETQHFESSFYYDYSDFSNDFDKPMTSQFLEKRNLLST
jgi:hypothetical protein